ncbi:fused (3R)-hydroxyacyl-ACP dehydratase subunits HadA/HadB [Nocardia sp. NPDC020380]|uniref:fused (3R)-hydroxyacyl-ACP dehydratase subunits HadA/HadB n=1 Tax=Nocardia sp. NPDC020380 TaxID=3364309 RepID=UPI0037A2FD96
MLEAPDTTSEPPSDLPDFDPVEHAHAMMGRWYTLDRQYEVGREKIREYATAVLDDHPAHWDEQAAAALGYPALLASPTLTSVLSGAVQYAMTELLAGYNLTSSVQTDQVLDYHRPILAGDRLVSNMVLSSFRQAFGGDMLVIENVLTDQHGEAVLTGATSVITRSGQTEENVAATRLIQDILHRGTDIIAERSPRLIEIPGWVPKFASYRSPHTPRLDSIRQGDELPSRAVTLTIGDLVRYAGVAGDSNPIHWHTGAAHAVGLERGVVAHGILTMAYGASFVTSWLGDPGGLKQYSVRMSTPVYVPADEPTTVQYTGKIKSIDAAAGTATVALTAMHEGRKIFGRATAVVQLT